VIRLGKKNVIIVVISLFCLSCGLEDVPYMDYILESYKRDNTYASIQLPSSSYAGYSSASYFTHFEIFYRIYISDEPLSGEINSSPLRRQINNSLDSDYQGLYYITDKTSTSANPSNLESVFSSRKYFKLTLQEDDIDNVLGSGSLGNTLEISFPPNTGYNPVLTLAGNTYTLQRAVSGPSITFNPEPNRNFLNHSELYDNANARDDINADVAALNKANATPSYTYVSMYIFAIGKDYISTIYSQPTHINIFRLPDAY